MPDGRLGVEQPGSPSHFLDAEQVVRGGFTNLRERLQIMQAVAPVCDPRSSASLTAGSSTDLDGVAVANGKTGKLFAVSVASSAACRWDIKTRVGGADVVRDVLFTGGLLGKPWDRWTSPDLEFVTLAGNGTNTFRVTVTNLDPSNAAAVYATAYWDEV